MQNQDAMVWMERREHSRKERLKIKRGMQSCLDCGNEDAQSRDELNPCSVPAEEKWAVSALPLRGWRGELRLNDAGLLEGNLHSKPSSIYRELRARPLIVFSLLMPRMEDLQMLFEMAMIKVPSVPGEQEAHTLKHERA